MNTLLLERESLRAPLSRALVSPSRRASSSPSGPVRPRVRRIPHSRAVERGVLGRLRARARHRRGNQRQLSQEGRKARSCRVRQRVRRLQEKAKKETHDEASKKGIHPKGSDADGDGVTGEGKEKKDWKGDDDGDGVPNAIDKDKKKKHSNASKEECDCGCKETHEASAGSVDKDKHKEGKIFKLPKGHSKEYGES